MATSRQRTIAIAVLLATLAVSGALFAQGTTSLVSIAVLPLDTEGIEMARARPAAGASETRQVDPTLILQRNIFDSETGDLTRVPEPVAEAEDEEAPAEEWDPSQPLPACDGSVRLVGALVDGVDGNRSFAAVTESSGTARLFRKGMEVDGREILAINPNHVVLRPRSGGPCELAMFQPERTPPARTPAVRATVTPPRAEARTAQGGISSDAMDEGISRVSDTQYTIQRSLVDSLLENQAELMRIVRIIPHQENGRTIGVKLYGIRRNSLLGRLGIQNGDMLRTINGYDMTSPDSALEAYARLRNAQNLTVSLVRRGQPSTMEYTVQ